MNNPALIYSLLATLLLIFFWSAFIKLPDFRAFLARHMTGLLTSIGAAVAVLVEGLSDPAPMTHRRVALLVLLASGAFISAITAYKAIPSNTQLTPK